MDEKKYSCVKMPLSPTSSSNPPEEDSQIMPTKIREYLEKTEEKIKELHAVFKLKETEKREIQKSIYEKKAMVKSINKDIRMEERKLNAIEQEFPMIDQELRNKYHFVAHLKGLYPEDP